MRIILSIAVVLWHSYPIVYGSEARNAVPLFLQPFVAVILPMFFALSGFLVAGSLLRCKTLISFLGLRMIRIFPALIVEVCISAILIGPLLTTVPLREYFTDDLFFRYFFNSIGHIQYQLPGMFPGNPIPRTVNGQLWTVPFELVCYVSLAVFVFFLGKNKPWLFLAFVAGLILWDSYDALAQFVSPSESQEVMIDRFRISVSGILLVAAFGAGVAMYMLRERLPYSQLLGAISFTISIAALYFGLDWFAVIAASYTTVWLGLTNLPKPFFLKYADYSYGIFLYGFVVQQAVVQLLPDFSEWYWNFGITMVFLVPLAAFSWHFVEKPCQKMKKFAFKAEELSEPYIRRFSSRRT